MVAPSEFSAQNFIDPSQSFALPLTNTHTPHTPPTHTQRHKAKKYWYNIHLWFTFFFCHVSNPPTKSLFFFTLLRAFVSEWVCVRYVCVNAVCVSFLSSSLPVCSVHVCVCVCAAAASECVSCVFACVAFVRLTTWTGQTRPNTRQHDTVRYPFLLKLLFFLSFSFYPSIDEAAVPKWMPSFDLIYTTNIVT